MSWSTQAIAYGALVALELDEASGTTAADSSSNARNGSLTGGSFGAAALANGLGTSVDLGVNDYVEIPNGAWTNVGQTWSAEITFRLDALPGTGGARGTIMSSRSDTNASSAWQIQVFNNVVNAFFFRTTSGAFIEVSSGLLSAGVTYHLVVRCSSTALQVLLNGTQVGSTATSGFAMIAPTRPIRLGNDERADRTGFDGQVSSFAFYDDALSDAQVSALYTETLGLPLTLSGALPMPTGSATVQTGSTVTTSGSLPMPSGTAAIQTGSSITATGTLAQPTGAFDVALGDASFATLDGTLPQPAGSFELTFRADTTLAGTLPTPAGSITLAATHVVTLDGNVATPGGAFTLSIDGSLTVLLDGTLAMPTGLADLDNAPPTAVGPERGRVRTSYGIATWEPPVEQPPATVAPVHARIAAHAYTSVTMDGTRPTFDALVTVDRARHRDRIVIAGRDITYYRGVHTPLPRFGLVSPLLYDAGTLNLPQVAACFETPGHGALSWLREGAPILVQRVDPDTNTVIATDYRGIVIGFGTNGRNLTVNLGGDATGRAALRDKQPPIFRRRNDLGWWWWNALAGPDSLRRPFGKVGGPTTGINLYDTGGSTYATYLDELAAKGTNLAGTQWTCDPIESGPNAGTYRVHRKDTTTITATVYLDDAHTVAQLQAHAAERPNRIYGTGVTPRGERAKFGVYPVLAERQRARFPNYLDPRPLEEGDTNADTDTNGGVTALLNRLSVTGYLSADDFAGGYDTDVTAAVRDLQEDAGLPETGKVNQVTWDALFDVDVVGYSTRGARVEPIAQAASVRRVRRNASGQVIGTNPAYDPQRLVVDRTLDFGTGVTRARMRDWARTDLGANTPGSTPSGNGRHWTGTIRFELGGLIHGEHTPGDPVTPGMLMHARALRPGHNLWLPLHDGGTLLHVSGVDINTDRQVVATVDTRARDTMTVWEVIARNQDNKRHPARAWIRDHRSSAGIKDAVTEFDEIGGTITDQDLTTGWNVFPVVAGQEGTIARLRLRMDRPAEYVTAVFGRRISPRRLAGTIGNPLEHAGAKRWSDADRLDKLVGDHVLLYVAGDDQAPCGYYPGTKETRTYTPQVPNPAYNVDVAPDHPKFDNQETLAEQVPNPAYNPADPENDQEFVDKVVTETTTAATGRWVDDAGFGYRTFSARGGAVAEGGCVLWVAIYLRHARTLQGGRIMWPQLEAGA